MNSITPIPSHNSQLGVPSRDCADGPPSLNSHPSTLNHSAGGPHASVRAQLAIEVNTDNADADILHIRASDETLDRYKEVIVASGWRLENYLRNPVIQNAHQYGDIIFTIGRAEKTWVSGNALLQTWRFASNENPFAKIARDLYRGKFLQAASVGFVPLKWEDADPNQVGRIVPDEPSCNSERGVHAASPSGVRRRYLEQELLEVSAVAIPANPNALALAYKSGAIEKSDLKQTLDLLRAVTVVAVRQDTIPHEGEDPVTPQSTNPTIHQSTLDLLTLARTLRDLLKHT